MKIKLNEPKTLEFNIDTKGCEEKELKGFLRFSFEDVEYGFPVIFESGIIKVKIPAFQTLVSKHLIESIANHREITVNARLDIIANEDTFVTPWENEIDIEVPIDIQVKEEKKVYVNEVEAEVEAFDDAVKNSKIKDVLEKDVKPEVKVEEPEESEKIEEAKQYDFTFIDDKGNVISVGNKSGFAMKASSTANAVKKAKQNMKDFPGAKKVRLSIKGKRIGDFELSEKGKSKSRFAQSLSEIYVKEK